MAPAGPHESAMPALSPFGGTDPDSNTPGPAAVIAAGFGSPIALAAAPTTAAAAIGHHKHLLPCFTAFEQDGIAFTTPAVGPGFGMLGVSNQSHDEGQMSSGASSKAQGEAQDIWLPVLTPPSSMAPQGSQDMASAQKDLAPAIAQAAPTPVVAINGSPAHDRAARRQPITFDLGNCRLPQPGHGFVTRSLPRAVAQGKYKTPPSGEWVTYENAASGDRMHQAQAAKRVLQGADAEAASVPGGANGSALGVLSPRGGGHTPQNTPEFLAMLHDNELFEPEAGTQASEQPHVSGSGRDLGMLRVMSLDGVAHQASPAGIPGDGISFSTPAASSGLGVHGGFVQNYGEGQMPAGISPAAGTDGQGMSLDGVAQQPSAAGDNSAFGTPTTGISPGYGHILISTHGGGHMPTGMSPGSLGTICTNPFTMGVDQPNKRVADEAGKKGKPARKAAASIQSTVGPSKPTDATAHSSSSSSSILPAQEMPHGGGGQSGAAPAEPSSLEPTGAAQQAAPAAQRSAQMLPPLPRPGKRSRTDNTCQADPNYPPPLMSQASSGASPVLQKRKGPSRHPPLKATPLLMKKKPRGSMLPGAFSFTQGTAQLKAHRS
ncbi:hypothetical protein WJX82_008551 [Trebouxia sp. C0006]